MTETVARRCVLVLGMHRSGTSLLTRVAGALGAQLPREPLRPAEDNPKGFWEAAELVRVHDALLRDLHSSWDDWRPLSPERTREIPAERRDEIRSIIDQEFGSSALFVLKEPRICRFATFFLDVLKEMGVSSHIIIPFRNPLDVAGSLTKRNEFSQEKSVLLWLRYVLDAEYAARRFPRAFLSYDRLLMDWREAMSSVAGQIGLEWPRPFSDAASEIDEFLTPGLRHHARDEPDSESDPTLAWARDAYLALQILEHSPGDPRALKTLARIGREFSTAAALFDPEIARMGSQLATSLDAAEKAKAVLVERQEQISIMERAANEHCLQICRLQQALAEAQQATLRAREQWHAKSARLEVPKQATRDVAQMLGAEANFREHGRENERSSSSQRVETFGAKVAHAPRDASRYMRRSWRKLSDQLATQTGDQPADFNTGSLRDSRYRKALSSRLVLRFEPVLSRSFAKRMQNRMEKNAPLRLPSAALLKHTPLAPDWDLFDALSIEHNTQMRTPPLVDVIIPVYRGYDETLACIYSVLLSRNKTAFELLVIDDASPDAKLSEALDRLAGMGLITLLRNEQNLGFVATVNRGMSMHEARDVLLLNSDTLVFNDWLDRLRAHASSPDVASVTPFTNNGTICSYPVFCKDNPSALETAFCDLDLMAAALNQRQSVEVPTGVGFCMYVTRSALNRVGLFDVETFGRGYGEENDFCVNASIGGMRNLHALDVFVFHSGETSFGADASQAKQAGLDALVALHPGYLAEVADYIGSDPAKQARARLDAGRILRAAPERTILCFTHSMGGGIERYLRDRAASAAENGEHLLLAVPHPSDPSTIRLTGVDGRPALLNLPDFKIGGDEEDFAQFLQTLSVAAIEVHSTVGWSGRLLQSIPRVASALGMPFDFVAHDYASVCPQIHLINERGIYCGEEGEEQCQRCLKALTKMPRIVHPDIMTSGMADIAAWRKTYADFLKSARKVITPSDDTAKRLQRYFQRPDFASRPHTENIQGYARLVARPYLGGTLKVAVIGAIGPHKGAKILQRCAADALQRRLPIAFTIVGYTSISEAARKLKIGVTGRYTEREVFDRLEDVGAHIALLPSVWPETYCYALSIAIAGGFPVCAFDIGAPAQRLRGCPGSVLMPTSTMTDACSVNDTLLKMAAAAHGLALAS